jgi:hypothetical protein
VTTFKAYNRVTPGSTLAVKSHPATSESAGHRPHGPDPSQRHGDDPGPGRSATSPSVTGTLQIDTLGLSAALEFARPTLTPAAAPADSDAKPGLASHSSGALTAGVGSVWLAME